MTAPTLKSRSAREWMAMLDTLARVPDDFEAILVYHLAAFDGFAPDEVSSLRDYYSDRRRHYHGSQ